MEPGARTHVGNRRDRQRTIEAFNALHVHDATVQAVRIFPSTSKRRQSYVEVDLTEYVTCKPLLLRLTGSANVTLAADFQVLTDNAFANTEGVRATGDEKRIRQLMSEQMAHLNIEYYEVDEKPSARHPTRRKLTDVSSYILFQVTFYGGTLEVVARGFKLTRLRVGREPGPYGTRR
jgi:hypothetical protein